jgi:hypothetical protein
MSTRATSGAWVVAGLAVLALALGGCVAEAADEDVAPVDQAVNADRLVPARPSVPASGMQQGPPSSGSGTGRSKPAPVSPCTPYIDPEPSPWQPGNGSQNH